MNKKFFFLAMGMLLVLGIIMDLTEGGVFDEKNRLSRGESGSGQQDLQLKLNAAEGDRRILEDYDYELSVMEQIPDDKRKEELLKKAKKEIDEGFCKNGEELSHVTERVFFKEHYADGLVEASWIFTPDEIVNEKGVILEDHLKKEGVLVGASVRLTCYGKEENYEFSFMAYPSKKPLKEQLLRDVRREIDERQTEEGETYLTLPKRVDGVSLDWSESAPHYTIKFLVLEVLAGIGWLITKKERKKREEAQRLRQMQMDYPEIVSKLLILCGAGMSIKQSWHKISASYLEKRKKIKGFSRAIYEEIVYTDRQMEDGLSERIALREFGNRIPLTSYHRLGRLLVENLHRGAKGSENQMKREAEEAFEGRKQLAKKLGEEAGTKMMLPMMIMLMIVMAIVMVPAAINLQ